MWRGIERSWLYRRSTFSDCGYRDAFALKLRVADLLMASKIMTVGQGEIESTSSCINNNNIVFILFPVLRFELALIAMELRRNATFLLLMTSPTIFRFIELSTFTAFVKAYLSFLIKPLRISIRNGLICSRLTLLLLH